MKLRRAASGASKNGTNPLFLKSDIIFNPSHWHWHGVLNPRHASAADGEAAGCVTHTPPSGTRACDPDPSPHRALHFTLREFEFSVCKRFFSFSGSSSVSLEALATRTRVPTEPVSPSLHSFPPPAPGPARAFKLAAGPQSSAPPPPPPCPAYTPLGPRPSPTGPPPGPSTRRAPLARPSIPCPSPAAPAGRRLACLQRVPPAGPGSL